MSIQISARRTNTVGGFSGQQSESGNTVTILPHIRCRKHLKQNHFSNRLNHNNNCAYRYRTFLYFIYSLQYILVKALNLQMWINTVLKLKQWIVIHEDARGDEQLLMFYEPVDIFFTHVFYHLMTWLFFITTNLHLITVQIKTVGFDGRDKEEHGPSSGWPAGDLQRWASCVTFLVCCPLCLAPVRLWLHILFFFFFHFVCSGWEQLLREVS